MSSRYSLLLLIALSLGMINPARAASYQFDLLSAGVSVGQGSFSFSDTYLGNAAVNFDQFSTFNFSVDNERFNLQDLGLGTFEPSQNAFAFYGTGPDGAGEYLASNIGNLLQNNFVLYGKYTSPCYSYNECGPGAPPSVFEYYEIVSFNAADDKFHYSKFNDFSISIVISEPHTIFLMPTMILLFWITLIIGRISRPRLALHHFLIGSTGGSRSASGAQ